MTWIKLTLKSLYDEIFGEPVDHPIIIRGLAFAIDYLIFIFCTTLIYHGINAEEFISTGTLLLVEIFILTAYFTFSGSAVFAGQSIGKRIFRIRVVDGNAKYLGLGKSFIRSVPIPLIANGYLISYFLATEYENLAFIGHAVLATVLFSVLYFSIVNLNRQGLHDIVVNSQVIPRNRIVHTRNSISVALILPFVVIMCCYLIYIRINVMR